MITIIEIKNPFERRKEMREMVYLGGSITAYVECDGHDVYLNGAKVEDPEKTYPQDGEQIVVMPHVAGGVGKILGFVASIALMMYTGSIAGGLWSSGPASFFAKGAIGAFLAAGAVMYIGGRLINAIFPQQINNDTSGNQETTQSYGWDLPTVTTTQGGIIGETYGTCIPAPQLLEEHVETVDDKQYLNLLYCGGYGPVDSIERLRIDTTAIENFSDVQIETRLGTNEQEPISFFNDTPLDQSVGLELSLNKPLIRTSDSKKASALEVTVEFPGGLYHINDDGDYEKATVEFIAEYRKNGTETWSSFASRTSLMYDSKKLQDVSCYDNAPFETWTLTPVIESNKISYFKVSGSISGSSDNAYAGQLYDNGKIRFKYTGYSGNTNLVGIYSGISTNKIENTDITIRSGLISISEAVNSSIRKSFKINGIESAQYDVRITLITQPKGTRYCTNVDWTILTSYNSGTYSRPNKVLVALRVLATNQLSGGVPNLTWIQKRNNVYIWNPNNNSYEEKAANNPIWAAYDIMHRCRKIKDINTGNYEYVIYGVPKEAMTPYYDEWSEAAAYADEKIKNQNGEMESRFQFDAYFDTAQKTITAAQKAAAVGHAVIIPHGRNYGIKVDKPGSICQIFGEGKTTVSSVKGTFTSKEERARSVEITYNDEDNDFKNTVFSVRSPNYDSNDGTDNTAQLTLFGVRRKSQAYREAISSLATNERQLQSIEFNADIDAIVAEYGDIVGFSHTVSRIGIASGRIVSATATQIILDKDVNLSSKLSYEIYLQLQNDELVRKNIVANDITTNILNITTPFDEKKIPQKFDTYNFGEVNKAIKPFRIVNASRDKDLLCSLKLAEYDEAMYATDLDYSRYPIIDYTPSTDYGIRDLLAEENTYTLTNGTRISNIIVTWSFIMEP